MEKSILMLNVTDRVVFTSREKIDIMQALSLHTQSHNNVNRRIYNIYPVLKKKINITPCKEKIISTE